MLGGGELKHVNLTQMIEGKCQVARLEYSTYSRVEHTTLNQSNL